MSDVIQALKDNEKPFGLMTAEERQSCTDIAGDNFDWVDPSGEWQGAIGVKFHNHQTYRLRDDYKPEPEIVRIPIDPPSHSIRCLSFQKSDNIRPLTAAPEYPDFIGFEYEDGNIYPQPVMYSENGGFHFISSIKRFASGKDIAVRPTHVLFKK